MTNSNEHPVKHYIIRSIEDWHVTASSEEEALNKVFSDGVEVSSEKRAFDFRLKDDEDLDNAIQRTIDSL